MLSLDIYSPEEEIHNKLFEEKKLRVFLKRDDMIHPFISGNKWRKLKYHLQKARNENKDHIVTFGGVWSNHLIATACAASKFGLKATAFVRGEDINTDTLFMCRIFKMNLIFVDRQSYRDKRSLFDRIFRNDPLAYFIDEGGAGTEAVTGVAELMSELKGSYQHIFCAAGTGTTAAGILKGIFLEKKRPRLHIVPVLKGGNFLINEIKKLSSTSEEFDFHEDYHFGGYAKAPDTLLSFISDFAASTGILLDQVYTGKMMFALFDLIKHDYFREGSRILAIHTGGLFGLLGLRDKNGSNHKSDPQ